MKQQDPATVGASATPPIAFVRGGKVVRLEGVRADRTLLELIREDLHCTGTKEGCGEGDCGACTVVVGETRDGALAYRPVNSCIRMAHSIDGCALWTVEDLQGDQGELHPAQAALVHAHASQCGFCTPGFVMSLFGMYQNQVRRGLTITRESAQRDLSGNLCRCTGYRPILDAAQEMHALPDMSVDEAGIMRMLDALSSNDVPSAFAYMAPRTLEQALAARRDHPDALIVAGATDIGLRVTKGRQTLRQILDVSRCETLRQIIVGEKHVFIGAAATLEEAFAVLCADRPQLAEFAERFAGLPVRSAGTLGGNIVNGSPIGDSMPLLISLGARVVLASTRAHCDMPIEDFYTGYRSNLLATDELLFRVIVPRPVEGEILQAYKVSKRIDDDISAVCLAIRLELSGDTVASIRIGVGGVAAKCVRAVQTEQQLLGKPWSESSCRQASDALVAEFSPISDMRASAAYRRSVLGNLVQRFWHESRQGAAVPRPTLRHLKPIS